MRRPGLLSTQYSVLSTKSTLIALGLVSLLLYWLLWVPAYRLNERFEYSDLLFRAFPAIARLLAAQLGAVQAIVPAAVASYEATALLFCALLAVLFGLYVLALIVVPRVPRRAAVATVLGATLAFQVVLLPLPGVLTTDLFSYALYGEVAGRFGGSPYVQAPDDYATSPLYLLINPLWRDAPSVYGPVWIGLSSLVGAALGGHVLSEILTYRLIADLCHWANLGLLWWALRRLRPGCEPLGLALYAWNPLVVLEFAGNGHNDGTMLLFVLLCFGWLARGRVWLALAALVLSIATKYTTVVLLPLVLWWAVRERAGWRRVALAAGAGLAALAALAALYLPWWRGSATLGPVIYWLSTPMYANYAPIGVAGWVRDWLVARGWSWDDAEPLVFGIQRQVVRTAYLAYLAVETLRFTPLRAPRANGAAATTVPPPGCCAEGRTAPQGLGRPAAVIWALAVRLCRQGRGVGDLPLAGARAFLLFLLVVNTWVLPWYYTWPLALVALGRFHSRTTWLVLGFSLSAPLSMYWAQAHFGGLDPAGFVVYLAPLGLLGIWEAARRGWEGWHRDRVRALLTAPARGR